MHKVQIGSAHIQIIIWQTLLYLYICQIDAKENQFWKGTGERPVITTPGEKIAM